MDKRLLIALTLSLALLAGSSAPALACVKTSSIACPNPYDQAADFGQYYEQCFSGYTVSVSDEQYAAMKNQFDQMKTLEQQEQYLDAYAQLNLLNVAMNEVWTTAVYNYPAFSDFIAGWPLTSASADHLAGLESLYNDAVAIEKVQGAEASQAKWQEFYDLAWSVEDPALPCDYPPFEEYMTGWMPQGLNENDRAALEQDYNEAVALEEGGDPDGAAIKWEAFNKIIAAYTIWPSFEEYFGSTLTDLNISGGDIETMKSLYAEAVALEKSGDSEAASQKWTAMNNIQQPYWDNYVYQYPSFEEYIALYSVNISGGPMEQMKQVYTEAVALEQAGDVEGAADKWGAFYYILYKFAPMNPMTCCK